MQAGGTNSAGLVAPAAAVAFAVVASTVLAFTAAAAEIATDDDRARAERIAALELEVAVAEEAEAERIENVEVVRGILESLSGPFAESSPELPTKPLSADRLGSEGAGALAVIARTVSRPPAHIPLGTEGVSLRSLSPVLPAGTLRSESPTPRRTHARTPPSRWGSVSTPCSAVPTASRTGAAPGASAAKSRFGTAPVLTVADVFPSDGAAAAAAVLGDTDAGHAGAVCAVSGSATDGLADGGASGTDVPVTSPVVPVVSAGYGSSETAGAAGDGKSERGTAVPADIPLDGDGGRTRDDSSQAGAGSLGFKYLHHLGLLCDWRRDLKGSLMAVETLK